MREIFKRKQTKKKKYLPELRAFALTLNFYSSKAYNYVRKSFCNLLPEPSTIRKWYSVLNGRPGFTAEAFEALKCQVEKSDNPIICNIVIDEIAIRQQVTYDGQRYYGLIDFGVDHNDAFHVDHSLKATNALVFMLVAINGHWKIPVGYFLLNSLNGAERASLLEKCLELIEMTGVEVHFVTFDGASVNINMCKYLGANFELGTAFKPYFINPVTKKKNLLFF